MWIVYAQRPLTLEEIAEAIIFEPGQREIDSGERFTDPEDIMSVCGSLVRFNKSYYRKGSPTVTLAHYPVQECLTSERTAADITLSSFVRYMGPNQAHAYMASAYMLYWSQHFLRQDDLGSRYHLPEAFENKYPLMEYAAKSWSYHALRSKSQ